MEENQLDLRVLEKKSSTFEKYNKKIKAILFEYFFLVTNSHSSLILIISAILIKWILSLSLLFNSKVELIWENEKMEIIFKIAKYLDFNKNFTNYNDFLIYQMIFFLIIIGGYLLMFLILTLKNKKSQIFKFLVIINKFYIILFCIGLYIFFLQNLLINLNCVKIDKKYYLKEFNSEKCWEGHHIAIFIITIFIGICYFFKLTIFKLIYNEINQIKNLHFSKKISKCNFYLLLSNTFNIISVNFFEINIASYLLINLFLGFVIAFEFYFRNPFLNIYTKKMTEILSSIYFWNILIHNIRYFIEIENLFQIWVIGLFFLPLIIIFEGEKNFRYLLIKLEDSTSRQISNKLEDLVFCCENYKKDKKVELILNGFIEIHRKTCEDINCSIQKFDLSVSHKNEIFYKNLEHEKNTDLLNFIDDLFLRAIEKFPINFELRMNYFFFVFLKRNNIHSSKVSLKKMREIPLNIEEEFFIYKFEKLILDLDLTKRSDTIIEKNEDLENIKLKDNQNEIFLNEIKLNVLSFKRFWKELSKTNPDLNSIKKVGIDIYKKDQEIKKKWKDLKIKCEKITTIFGKYLFDIKGFYKSGEKLIAKERNLNSIEIQKKNNISFFNYPDSLINNPNAVIVVSGIKKNLGMILNISKEIVSILGYQKNFLLQKNISYLLPNPLNAKFDFLIKKLFLEKEDCFDKKPQLYHLIKENNHISEFYVEIKKLIIPSQMLVLFVVPKKDFYLKCDFFVNENRNIQYISSTCYSLFKIGFLDLEKSNDFDHYFPGLFENKKEFLQNNPVAFEVDKFLIKDKNFLNNKYQIFLKLVENKWEEKSCYIFEFVFKKKKKTSNLQIKEINYQYVLSEKESIIIKKKDFSEKIKNPVLDLKKKNKINPNYKEDNQGKNVKVLKLENGKAAELFDNISEEYLTEENLSSKNIKTNSKKNDKSKLVYLIEYLNKKKNLFQKINFCSTPLFLKFSVILLHLLFAAFIVLLFFNKNLKNKNLSKTNYLFNYFSKFNVIQKEFQVILAEIQKLKIIANNEINYNEENISKNSIYFSINKIKTLQQIMWDWETALEKISDLHIMPNNQVEIFYDSTNFKIIKYQELIKNLLVHFYSFVKMNLNEIKNDVFLTNYIFQNLINAFWKESQNINKYIMEDIEKNLDFERYFIFIQIAFLVCFFFVVLVFIYLKIQIRKKEFIILSIFTYISKEFVTIYIKNCENYLKTITNHKRNLFLGIKSKISQNVYFDFLKKRTVKLKKKLLKKLKFTKYIFVQLLFFFIILESILLLDYFYFKKSILNLEDWKNELSILSTIAPKLNHLKNGLYFYITKSDIKIENMLSEEFLEKSLYESLTDIGLLSKYATNNKIKHSETFKDFNHDILNTNICELIEKQKNSKYFKDDNTFFKPKFKKCKNLEESENSIHFVSEGLLIGFSKYRDTLNEIKKKFLLLLEKKNNFFQNNYCQKIIEDFDYCIFNHDVFEKVDFFQNYILNFWQEVWLDFFLIDLRENFIKNIENFIIYFYYAFLVVLCFFYFVCFLQFIFKTIYKIKIIENMILMIPSHNYEDSDYIREYLKKNFYQIVND